MRNPYVSLIRKAWSYARQEKKRFLVVYAMFIITNLIIAINPIFYGWFVNALQQGGTDALTHGWMYVGGFIGLKLLEWCFHGPARVMERQVAFHVSRNFLEDLYHQVLHLPVKWHQDHHSGATISRLQKAHGSLRDFYQNGFIYIHSFSKFVLSFGAMLYFSPLFGAIGVAIGAVTVYIIMCFDRPFIKTLREVNEKEHQVSSTLFDSLSNIVTVITLRLESRIKAGYFDKLAAVFPPFRRNVVINEWKWFTAQMMVALIYGVITLGYLYQHHVPGEAFQIGGLVILLGYVNQFTSVFNDIASQYTQIVKYDTDVQNVQEIEQAFVAHQGTAHAAALPGNWQSLDIRHLTFRRIDVQTQRSTGLNDLSVRIKKGERVALIGESGCGKSTLLATLRGLYAPQSATVLADQQAVDFRSIAQTVTLLPQEPEIFENTIRYNITLGLPFRDEEVMAACRAAQFAEVVQQLPQGLDTSIVEKGVNLSGGQKQRLALARGILAARSSDIILLDEPTSSIDPRTEQKIYQALFAAFEGKAVVSSLHRLHLLQHFDYIYILRQGTVVDEGRFEELKRYSLVFKEMWEHQATTTAPAPIQHEGAVIPMNPAANTELPVLNAANA